MSMEWSMSSVLVYPNNASASGLTSAIRPSRSTATAASSDTSSTPRNVATSRLRSLMSRGASMTTDCPPIRVRVSMISAANSDPSRRRATSCVAASPRPIAVSPPPAFSGEERRSRKELGIRTSSCRAMSASRSYPKSPAAAALAYTIAPSPSTQRIAPGTMSRRPADCRSTTGSLTVISVPRPGPPDARSRRPRAWSVPQLLDHALRVIARGVHAD